MFAKRLFFVSASILMLAFAYHLGASTATAQAPSNPVVGITYAQTSIYGATVAAVTANGDYYFDSGSNGHFVRVGNVFVGGATTTQTETMGQLKARYR
jgi:hypothetical protein